MSLEVNSQYSTDLQSIEKYWSFPIPKPYQLILMNVIENEIFEYIGNAEQDDEFYICFYPSHALIERNQTYEIQIYEPNYLMIGQDGDLGYFISNIHSDLNLYGLDLGALGSLPFDVITADYQTLFNQ